ncbi:spore germination protein [Brevibacillus centrosporus]|uniref:spore germination protein n=1 Tax=Brevibacillus centrosporus TaxID=54910 RepID=UPI00381F31B3
MDNRVIRDHYLIRQFENNSDFKSEYSEMCGVEVLICYLDTLVDTAASVELKKLMRELNVSPESWKPLDAEINVGIDQLENAILTGRLVILHATGSLVLKPKMRQLERSVTSPESETSIQGSSDAFTESILYNIGILRKHLRSSRLTIQEMDMGEISRRKIAVCHLPGTPSESIAKRILALLQARKNREINSVQDLAKALGQRYWSPVPLFFTSELPEDTSTLLLKGRVVLLLDQLPFALVTPTIISDLWTVDSDKNMSQTIVVTLCALRIIGIIISLLVPGLYVALVSVNPELFRIEMALSVAKSREGVPYPAIIEMILMLIVIEMIVSASIRLPKTVGPTITMVGGIILGQAAVQAQLVSNLLLIVLSATVISNYTFVGTQNALMIRLFKYCNVLLGSIFGVLGILAGLVGTLFYFASITSFQVPFLGLGMRAEGNDE